MTIARVLLITCLIGICLWEVHSHGMMLDPVSRSSAWRKGYPVEPNYDDNALYCGGRQIQYEQNHGKCGLCGDDYALPQPRPNENGGIYGTGVIVEKYKVHQNITVKVKLTMNHMGTFTFDLCPLEKPSDLETEECFSRYPLRVNGRYTVPVPNTKMDFDLPIELPESLVCNQCVLRWTYRAGNNWGNCGDGRQALGCGPQETFKNCADVQISS
ncbi:hypothetical protein WN48_02330 [Eufriesea mexicana]|uniref:uncharacterized protein LOC108548884 n=1 Tax=Eufriesea mexicana TaxID=516756 RepID=UPI00083BBF06|nr:PREDICTED: uncharacterized protein LOC108548884 [Eufriesea mexicana]OAD56806.1 hypothetical protein WN48_02330 [Eufriesea mexicana]